MNFFTADPHFGHANIINPTLTPNVHDFPIFI